MGDAKTPPFPVACNASVGDNSGDVEGGIDGKVVAAMLVPESHQVRERPDTKKSSKLLEALRDRNNPIPIVKTRYSNTITQSIALISPFVVVVAVRIVDYLLMQLRVFRIEVSFLGAERLQFKKDRLCGNDPQVF